MMKKLLLTGLMVAAGLASAGYAADAPAAPKGPDADYKTTPAGTYVLDNSHASITWKVWHMGTSHFAGRFDKISGTATVNPADLTKSGVVVTVDAASGDTNVAKLDAELKEDGFFNSEKYPAITFTSTKIELTGKTADGKDTGKITGMLSMLGVTKPVVLDVTFNGHGVSPMGGAERMGFNGTTTIKRSDFGFTKLVPLVSDEVEIDIAAEFAKAS